MPDISTSSWGKALDDLVDALFYQVADQQKPMYPKIFNVENMSKAQIKHLTGVGFEDWRQSGEAVAASYTRNLQGFTKTYVPTVWKSGFTVTRELRDDVRFKKVANDTRELAQTSIRTIDKEAAKLLNNATNTTYFSGADALALATTHTGEDGSASIDNAVSGALTEVNLEAARIYFAELVDGRGQLIDSNPQWLLVPPALQKEANIILKSTARPATGDNDINDLQNFLSVMVWPRLASSQGGSDTAWIVLDKTYNDKRGEGDEGAIGLNMLMRVRPEITSETNIETGVKKYVGYMRLAQGFTDFREAYHSTGTA